MEKWFDLTRQEGVDGVWKSMKDGEFEEEEIWDVVIETKGSNPKPFKSIESNLSVPRKFTTSSKMIPVDHFTTSSSNEEVQVKLVQESAPVKIPDWSAIRGRKSRRQFYGQPNSWIDEVDHNLGGSDDDDNHHDDFVLMSGDDDDYNYYKVPPHEFIANRLARGHISSFSVFEGVGRTLKGRDLSKVRNAVLIKTGFLESL